MLANAVFGANLHENARTTKWPPKIRRWCTRWPPYSICAAFCYVYLYSKKAVFSENDALGAKRLLFLQCSPPAARPSDEMVKKNPPISNKMAAIKRICLLITNLAEWHRNGCFCHKFGCFLCLRTLFAAPIVMMTPGLQHDERKSDLDAQDGRHTAYVQLFATYIYIWK